VRLYVRPFGKLPDDWYYRTYQWFKYFDKTQRDQSRKVLVPSTLTTANPKNVVKWKEVATKIFVVDFKSQKQQQKAKTNQLTSNGLQRQQ